MQQLRLFATRVLAAELFVVAAIVAASIISERFLLLACTVIALIWLVRLINYLLQRSASATRQTHHESSIATTATSFVVLLLIMLSVAVVITAFPNITLPQVLRVLTGVALFYAIISWVGATLNRNRLSLAIARLNLLGIALTVVLIALSVSGPFIVVWHGSKFSIIPESVYAPFPLLVADGVNPNVLAGSLVVLIPIPIARLLFRQPKEHEGDGARWMKSKLATVALPIIALVVSLPVLLLTQSRGAWSAFVVMLVVLIVLRWRRMLLPLVIMVLAGLLYVLLQPGQSSSLLDVLLSGGAINGLDQRVEIWSRAWYMIQDFAFTGIGMGGFEQVTNLLYPLIITPPGIPHAHNLFLQVAVDLGIPGFIAWLGVFVAVMIACVRVLRSGCFALTALAAGLLGSQVALAVHGLTDAVTWGIVRTAPLVWALWGLAIGAWIATKTHETCKSD